MLVVAVADVVVLLPSIITGMASSVSFVNMVILRPRFVFCDIFVFAFGTALLVLLDSGESSSSSSSSSSASPVLPGPIPAGDRLVGVFAEFRFVFDDFLGMLSVCSSM